MKKIIYVLGSSRIAGTEVQTLNLSEEILRIGIETELWILEKKGKLDDLPQTNLRITHYPILNVSWFRKIHNFARLVLAIQQNKKAIFHTQLPAPSILIYVAKHFISKEITQIVGIRGKIKNRGLVAELILKKCFKSTNGIIVNSPHLLSEALSRFQLSESHINIIPNGVKPGNKIANTTIQPARIVVLANFISYKGHSLLIDAIEKSSIKNHYTFCGEGPMESLLKEKIKSRSLQNQIIFTQVFENNFDFLANYQFAVHPSETEGLSNAILEEIASGLPIIAFNVGGNSLLVRSGENGFLIDSFSSDLLASSIDSMSQNSERRKEMGEKSILIAQEFTWTKCVQRHIEFYDSCEIRKRGRVDERK